MLNPYSSHCTLPLAAVNKFKDELVGVLGETPIFNSYKTINSWPVFNTTADPLGPSVNRILLNNVCEFAVGDHPNPISLIVVDNLSVTVFK